MLATTRKMLSLAVIPLVYLTLCTAALQAVQDKPILFHFRTNSSEDVLNDINLELADTDDFILKASGNLSKGVHILFMYEGSDNTLNSTEVIALNVSEPSYSVGVTYWHLAAMGTAPGHVTLIVGNVTEEDNSLSYNVSSAFVRFQVFHSQPLNVVSDVIGWLYFVAWSVSFYPQIWLNWRRKSVVGLNFDFLALNLTGFLCYAAYNVALFWIKTVQDDFRTINPHDLLPVEVNDVVFALHAAVMCAIAVLQVFIYERGGQTMSHVARFLLLICVGVVIIVVTLAIVPQANFSWFDMVSGLSYVKLGITIVKYIPQAWMNFRRKSTIGWSIGNVLLDFTGGTCSTIQMFILAYNFNDWASIFLNPVKFWLGALSIFFDIIFMMQHYCLYRDRGTTYTMLATAEDDGLESEVAVKT